MGQSVGTVIERQINDQSGRRRLAVDATLRLQAHTKCVMTVFNFQAVRQLRRSIGSPRTSFISYAQNSDDFMLTRALRGVERGFYIDVVAAEPETG